jgi:hypothetical protein
MFRLFVLLASVVALATGAAARGDPPVAEVDLIEADPDMQAQLSAALVARDELLFFRELLVLRRMAGDDMEEVVRQTVVYQLRHPRDERWGWVLPMVFHYLRVTEHDRVRALAPLLSSEDERVRSLAKSHLPSANLRVYHSYVEARKDAPPATLVAFLFGESPAQAMRLMMGMYLRDRARWRELVWAEHVVGDAIWKKEYGFLTEADTAAARGALGALGAADEWWARAYAAAVIAEHRWLGESQLLSRLQADESEFVRGAAAGGVDREVSGPTGRETTD